MARAKTAGADGDQGDDLRTRILTEAMLAIAETGLSGLTMSALARRLDTSGGHLLYYFGTKDRLLLEALRHSEGGLARERLALTAGRGSPARRLDRFMRLYLPTGARDPRWMLWIELWPRSGGDPALRDAQRELDRAWESDLVTLLADGAERGVFALPDPPARAAQLLALLDGLSTRVLLGHDDLDRNGAIAAARSAASALIPGA
ncbi:TetR/AcrR family transcriptional regulator [uncultured Streptomyces sp.]|uniref:TetR/AcrR family transcriptional regulator n=1 Tax=uncultured Streptomyces sp. TaxID=174707 RepID=UPI0026018188|nr:TetR/AcrR family transcriptional regulator [uncultured Streptomyces sp.]